MNFQLVYLLFLLLEINCEEVRIEGRSRHLIELVSGLLNQHPTNNLPNNSPPGVSFSRNPLLVLSNLPGSLATQMIDHVSKRRMCQMDNVNGYISALPGNDPNEPCKVHCQEELGGGGFLGFQHKRYFSLLMPDNTPCGGGLVCIRGQCISLTEVTNPLPNDPPHLQDDNLNRTDDRLTSQHKIILNLTTPRG